MAKSWDEYRLDDPYESPRRKGLKTVGIVAALMAITILPAVAASGGKGKGHTDTASAPCTVSNRVVYGTGLPTDQVINFMITDASGTWGFVLGFTPDGNWSVNAPAPNGPTTYQFVSRTYGSDGSKYNVFQSCSA
jgi:hypothetical protein